jgi:hypothetical protein
VAAALQISTTDSLGSQEMMKPWLKSLSQHQSLDSARPAIDELMKSPAVKRAAAQAMERAERAGSEPRVALAFTACAGDSTMKSEANVFVPQLQRTDSACSSANTPNCSQPEQPLEGVAAG